jgi:alpha-amylase/alpha-mannosidase (GH57 family)
MLLMNSRMPSIRILFLWHMHQPFYKDLVTGQYRLPWVRLHALKDYFGMVKLLEEFPGVHQTFNLVPSLIAQIQDYVSGNANDPFWEVASRPASELGLEERRFALQYLFQANTENMIGRYPRYRELWQKFHPTPEQAGRLAGRVSDAELADLQVLSQIAWMDEFFLEEPAIRELVQKGRDYSSEDQKLVLQKQKEFLSRVLPEYASAAKRGSIEISTSPFYHPILPLLCDTNAGAISHAGLPLPAERFQHPEDAREQIERGLALHEQVFGVRPQGMWPSEGSVSDPVLAIAHQCGLNWLATDEGVLGRSIGFLFHRDGSGKLDAQGAERLYRIYRWERDAANVHVLFRDHSLSDLIGFVYSGVPPQEAARDFIHRVKDSASPLLAKGKDAIVPVILDGENAWESYPRSGREFLRQLYDAIERDPLFEALTVSEAIAREERPATIGSIFPGSWINANFDVWIGAPEDNLAWDYLSAARDFYAEQADASSPQQQRLAHEELLIAEGSDWNWWYGPEHHSANDGDFDELYRKHLANVYHALGSAPPDVLAQPIASMRARPQFTPQTAYIHPSIDGRNIGYFDWLGAATHIADRHSSAMHGKLFLLDTAYAGIDEENLYCRLDFMEPASEWAGESTILLLIIETAEKPFRLEAEISSEGLKSSGFAPNGSEKRIENDISLRVRLESIFEAQVPLRLLGVRQGAGLRVRFSLWRDRLPLDALPQEGSIELRVLPEEELAALPYAKP